MGYMRYLYQHQLAIYMHSHLIYYQYDCGGGCPHYAPLQRQRVAQAHMALAAFLRAIDRHHVPPEQCQLSWSLATDSLTHSLTQLNSLTHSYHARPWPAVVFRPAR